MATSSILILTTSEPQATAFVTRLLAHSNLPAPTAIGNNKPIDYAIDNKYYSAVVPIVIQQLDEADAHEQGGDFPVVIWLLPEGDELTSRSIPSTLKTYLSTSSSPPDVALAILTSSSSPTPSELPEDLSDAYDDLGMELIDEAAVSVEEADEEDEDYSPPLPPLEQISQAIQTHLWPNLVLKAQPSSSQSKHARASTSTSAPPPSSKTTVAFPQSFSSDDSLPSPLTDAQEDDGFGPLQSSSDASTSALDFISPDFLAALSSSSQPHLLTTQKKQRTAGERSFTDSFAPAPAPAPFSSTQTQPPSFVPPPLNGELLSDFDLSKFPSTSSSSSDPFAGLDAGFQRLVDSDDDEEEGGNARGLKDRDLDLTSTLLSLRGLREELGRVEDEGERRELAGRVVEGLFGMLGEEEEEEAREEFGEVGGGERR